METNNEVKVYTDFNQVDPKNDLQFAINPQAHSIYYRDNFIKTFIEKAFGISLVGCYYNGARKYPSKTTMDIGNKELILYFESGKITTMCNSEWGFITMEKE